MRVRVSRLSAYAPPVRRTGSTISELASLPVINDEVWGRILLHLAMFTDFCDL